MDYFKLTRAFWDFAFENPEKIKPNHCALYLFIVEHCNRLGWKKKFGLPTEMTKEAIGIRSYNTYIKTLNDLVEFGLIELIEKSKNQYSSNIIAISNFNKAFDKALDKASIMHVTKQIESTIQSIDSIDKHITNNNIQYTINNKEIENENLLKGLNQNFYDELLISEMWIEMVCKNNIPKFNKNQIITKLLEFKNDLEMRFDKKINKADFASHFVRWLNLQKNNSVKPFFDSPA
jgi:hypothetical protein